MAGGLEADAAGAEVEEHVLIDGAGGGAVGAFDVVGVNLERGLGVHGGVVAEQEGFAGLFGVGFLSRAADEDFALEYAGGFVGQDVLVKLVAGTIRAGVIEQGVVVAVLGIIQDHQAVQRGICVLAAHANGQVVARQFAAERGRVRDKSRSRLKVHVHVGDVESIARFLLEFAVIDAAVFGGDDFGRCIGPVCAGQSDKTFNDLHFRVFFNHHKSARMRNSGFRILRGDKEQVDWAFNRGRSRHVDEDAVFEKGSVQSCEGVDGQVYLAGEMFPSDGIVLCDGLSKTGDGHAAGERADAG